MSKLTDEEFKRLNSCQTEDDWNVACLAVKAARGGGYPLDWYPKMTATGLMKEIFARFGQKLEFKVTTVDSEADLGNFTACPAYGGPPHFEEDQEFFSVFLNAVGSDKIKVIQALRAKMGMSLGYAKELVDGPFPKRIQDNVHKADAEDTKERLTKAGATVTVQ